MRAGRFFFTDSDVDSGQGPSEDASESTPTNSDAAVRNRRMRLTIFIRDYMEAAEDAKRRNDEIERQLRSRQRFRQGAPRPR